MPGGDPVPVIDRVLWIAGLLVLLWVLGVGARLSA